MVYWWMCQDIKHVYVCVCQLCFLDFLTLFLFWRPEFWNNYGSLPGGQLIAVIFHQAHSSLACPPSQHTHTDTVSCLSNQFSQRDQAVWHIYETHVQQGDTAWRSPIITLQPIHSLITLQTGLRHMRVTHVYTRLLRIDCALQASVL